MRDKLNKRYFILALFTCAVLILVFNSLTSHFQVQYLLESSKKMISISDDTPLALTNEQKYTHPYIEYQRWAINFNVLQYSSFILLLDENRNRTRVETLFSFGFLDNEGLINDTYTHTTVQCALRHKITKNVSLYPATKVMRLFARPMSNLTYRVPWKAMCEIDRLPEPYMWDVAIVDVPDQYEKRLTYDIAPEEMNQLLQFQTAKVIDTTVPKQKAIAHCMHSIRYLNEVKTTKLLKWIRTHKMLGYKEIKIYFFENATNTTNSIYEHFNLDFVKIVQHQMAYEEVCEWYMNFLTLNPSSNLAIFLNSYCKAIWMRNFIFTENFNDETNFIHGRSMTNDCYLQYKYKYEFTTNYDFDEVLLPRKYKPFEMHTNEKYTKCDAEDFKKYRYNVYDYAVELFDTYGRHNTSSIEFDCLPYLVNDQNMTSFLTRLETQLEKKTLLKAKFNQTNATITIPLEKIIFPLGYVGNIFYVITQNDYDYIEYVLNMYKAYQCLRGLANPNHMHLEVNNAIVSAYNLSYYHMKSIFNTDLTEFTTFHYGSPAPNSFIVKLPIQTGYVSHLRDKTERYYHNEKISIREFGIDLEYYKFFLNYY